MEHDRPLGIRPLRRGDLKQSGRRRVTPDLGIAFIGEDPEIVLLRQRQEVGKIVGRGSPTAHREAETAKAHRG